MFNLVPQIRFRCGCWRIFVIIRRRFRSLTAFAAEWCAPPYETTGRRWAAGKNCRCLKFYNRRPSSPPFSSMRRTIPPATIGAGGISFVQRQISPKQSESSLRNLSDYPCLVDHQAAVEGDVFRLAGAPRDVVVLGQLVAEAAHEGGADAAALLVDGIAGGSTSSSMLCSILAES